MEDERVVVFDIRSKTSSEGVVLEVLGRNTSLDVVNGVSRHISGGRLTENMSDRKSFDKSDRKSSDKSDRKSSDKSDGKSSDSSDLGDENLEANLHFDNDQIQLEDDNVASDPTVGSIDIPRPQGPPRLNRKYNRMRRRIVQNSRLRSGI